jgi:dUTP pyrophosphatase
MQPIELPVLRLDKTLDMPAYAYVGDAGMDLRAAEDAVLAPFERKLVSCGIAVAIPQGYAGFVLPRSGLAAKHGISIVNAPGLIDSNYRGEIKAILVNLDPENEFVIAHGDRIAQLVIMAVPAVTTTEVDELDETVRGAGGFGSSGVSQ